VLHGDQVVTVECLFYLFGFLGVYEDEPLLFPPRSPERMGTSPPIASDVVRGNRYEPSYCLRDHRREHLSLFGALDSFESP
jgi:hypothetical protein